jgi:uncharacterized membrane protein
MTSLRQSARQWLLLALAIAGVGIAIYLTSVHYASVPLLCSSQGVVNCERVTSSSYSVIPGTTIPITLPGIAWFVVSAALSILAMRWSQRWIRGAEVVWTALGMLVVLYLIYAEIVALHTLCLWCSAVHVLIFVSLIVAIVEFYLSGRESMAEAEDTASPHLAGRHRKGA